MKNENETKDSLLSSFKYKYMLNETSFREKEECIVDNISVALCHINNAIVQASDAMKRGAISKAGDNYIVHCLAELTGQCTKLLDVLNGVKGRS